MSGQRRIFLLIDRKSFDVVCKGKNIDGLRISENGRGFRASIFLEEGEE